LKEKKKKLIIEFKNLYKLMSYNFVYFEGNNNSQMVLYQLFLCKNIYQCRVHNFLLGLYHPMNCDCHHLHHPNEIYLMSKNHIQNLQKEVTSKRQLHSESTIKIQKLISESSSSSWMWIYNPRPNLTNF